jgi:hypothetical protein
MHDTMLNRTVFFLHKGELRLDSRGTTAWPTG